MGLHTKGQISKNNLTIGCCRTCERRIVGLVNEIRSPKSTLKFLSQPDEVDNIRRYQDLSASVHFRRPCWKVMRFALPCAISCHESTTLCIETQIGVQYQTRVFCSQIG